MHPATPQHSATSPLIMDQCIGGVWPAVQSLVAFLVTNIFAHAATIYLPAGAGKVASLRTILGAILIPVLAGDYAFHILGGWITRLRSGQLSFTSAFGGDAFEDAATSGAVAICVPLRFAPLLIGRWYAATPMQQVVMLDNTNFWAPDDNPRTFAGKRVPTVGKQVGQMPRYLPFILPSTAKFPGYQHSLIAPSSSALSQIIAIVQLFLSSRQLYQNYGASLLDQGLASPYLVVIPYMLMTLVNLTANTFVGQYPQITVIPMAKEELPDMNEIHLIDYREFPRAWIPPLCPASQMSVVNRPPVFPSVVSEKLNPEASSSAEPVVAESSESKLSSTLVTIPEDGPEPEWVIPGLETELPTTGRLETVPEVPNICDKPILNLGMLHIRRREVWTSIYYNISWTFHIGSPDQEKNIPGPTPGSNAEGLKKTSLFVRQNFLSLSPWAIMQHSLSGQQELDAFAQWLRVNYPGVEVDLTKLPTRLGWSYLVSGIFLQTLVTVMLGALTHFRVGITSHAAWLLLWMYGGPSLRWTWLMTMDRDPCPSLLKWCMSLFFFFLSLLVAVGVYGGITVICVELFGAMCLIKDLSLAPKVWVLIGWLIAMTIGLAITIVAVSPQILGISLLLVVN